MEDLNNTTPTDSMPVSGAPRKNNLRPVKFIIVFVVGILAAKGIFVILDKKVIKQKTTQTKPMSQVVTKITRSSERNNASIKKDVSPVSVLLPPSFPELTLNGIAASGESGWAIINGRVVKPGDKIKDAKIVGITEEKVYLDFKDESFTLTFE